MCKTLCMNIRHVICLPEIKATIYNCKILSMRPQFLKIYV